MSHCLFACDRPRCECRNIFRDPRWGRGQETPGEDPVLNSDYAAGFVSGFQTGEDPRHLKASSCCKHYAGYSLESWSPQGPDDPKPTTRHDFNAIISEQDLTDTYFPPFMSCANRGNASGIMCSYSKSSTRIAHSTELVELVQNCVQISRRAVRVCRRCEWGSLLRVARPAE